MCRRLWPVLLSNKRRFYFAIQPIYELLQDITDSLVFVKKAFFTPIYTGVLKYFTCLQRLYI